MLIIKALTKIFEDWGKDENNFFVSYQVDIGLEEIKYSSDMFSFDVVSPERLYWILKSQKVKFGHGILVMNSFNQIEIEKKIEGLVEACQSLKEQDAYISISKYLRWEMESFRPKLE